MKKLSLILMLVNLCGFLIWKFSNFSLSQSVALFYVLNVVSCTFYFGVKFWSDSNKQMDETGRALIQEKMRLCTLSIGVLLLPLIIFNNIGKESTLFILFGFVLMCFDLVKLLIQVRSGGMQPDQTNPIASKILNFSANQFFITSAFLFSATYVIYSIAPGNGFYLFFNGEAQIFPITIFLFAGGLYLLIEAAKKKFKSTKDS